MFGVFNFITSFSEAVVSTAIEGFRNCLIIFVPHGPLFEHPHIAQNVISIRCGMCAFTFALLAVHFHYRYLAVCRPLAIGKFFRWKSVFYNSIFVVCYGSSWMLIGHVIMWPDDHIHGLIDGMFREKYNVSSRELAMIVANYEYPVHAWRKSGILGMLIATVITSGVTVSYVYFAHRIHKSLKECTLSKAVKQLHVSLLKSLIAQTVIPLTSTIIPCFVIWFLPIAGDNFGSLLSTYFMPLLSMYPAVDPIVITLSLSDYRKQVMKLIGIYSPEKDISSNKFDNLFTVAS